MKKVSFISLLLLSTLLQAQVSKPNIIVFLVDDMGWQDTSVPFWNQKTHFNEIYETPNMERLAKNGIKMTNAYANPVCTPSRISLMTGMNVTRHHVTNWTSPFKDTPTDNPDSLLVPPQWNINGLTIFPNQPNTIQATPLPKLLKEAGYFTIHCGKAHFAPFGISASNPLNIGFDVNIAGTSAGHPASYLGINNFRKNPADTVWGVRNLEKYFGKDIFLTEALTLEALDAVKRSQQKKKPFFLYMSHYAIHLPFDKDERYFQKYKDKGLTDNEAKYAALIEGMDKSLGDIMNYLKKNRLDRNTYIFFLSDNGGFGLNPQRTGPALTQNLPLKQGKGSIYEGGIRIPFIATGPTIARNGVSGQYISIDDIFPTVLKIAKVQNYKTIQHVDGQNIKPFLESRNKRDNARQLFWHYPNNWTNINVHGISWASAMRQGDWKLIYFHKTQTLELFNLKDDIGEQKDLASSYPEKVKTMAKVLTNELKIRKSQLPTVKSTGKTIPWPDEI